MMVVQLKEIQNKRRRERRKEALIKFVCLLIIALGVVTWCMTLCGAVSGREATEYEYHTANALWDFVKFCPVDMDRWEYIEEVMELNGMENETVYPGRVYMVPIYK